ncbi:ABC transporter permease [Solwaraspora sp. WMMB335]|uniref:ABC transporter permease n=1 Tax=Solwaraspora sp. WMMB335 TaxID=3404118 RepID=UPI003B935450
MTDPIAQAALVDRPAARPGTDAAGGTGGHGGADTEPGAPAQARDPWHTTVRRFMRSQPLGAVSVVVILGFVGTALLAPLIAPYDPITQHRDYILGAPTGEYLLGTDDLGRDVLSRTIHGARTSLLIGLATTAISVSIGTLLGILSGYLGRGTDMVVQRIADAIQAIPPIVLLLFIAVLLGPSVRNTVIALIVVTMPSFNRVARGETLRIREEGYVEAARSTGSGPARIMRKHVLPNMLAPMFTMATLVFASVIIAESALSFLGIGTPPPTPSWGRMISEGLRFVEQAPWLVVAPGVVLSLAVFGFNLLGDALRDFLDPKLTSHRG